MMTGLFNYKLQVLLATLITLSMPLTINTGMMENMDRDLEEWYLSHLDQVQNTPGTELNPFTTDGCSGGLSEGWNSFARFLPEFKNKFGEKPPWESCCIEHDRAYWKGEVVDGYNKRLEADIVLRECVIKYGEKNSKRLAKKFTVDEQQIQQQFSYAGGLMYRAVRVGGKPCSFLPWRWGYGWPHCKVLPIPGQDETPNASIKGK